MEPVLGIAAAIAFFAGVSGLAWYVHKKRAEAFQAWAASNAFAADTAGGIPSDFDGFRLFNQGRNRKVRNLLRGNKEVGQVLLCDFSYDTGGGKNRTTHNQTVCVVRTPGRRTDPFFIRRQRALFDTIGKLFGGQDVNFEDDPTFSRNWVLQGDEQHVRRLFTQRLRDWFSDHVGKDLIAEAQGEHLLVHYGRVVKPEHLSDLVATATNLRRHWT